MAVIFTAFVHEILANKANLGPELLQCFVSLMSHRKWDIITRYTSAE